jgi:phenol 2-monooxygenase (NADPH)
VIDVRAIFQQGHRELAIEQMPTVLLPRKGKFGVIDYQKLFCPDPGSDDIFELREVNRETGCVVVVRPDQYVSHVVPLHAHAELSDFFAGILIEPGQP